MCNLGPRLPRMLSTAVTVLSTKNTTSFIATVCRQLHFTIAWQLVRLEVKRHMQFILIRACNCLWHPDEGITVVMVMHAAGQVAGMAFACR